MAPKKKGEAKRTTPVAQSPSIPTNPELPHTNPEQSQATQPRVHMSQLDGRQQDLPDQDHQAEAGNGLNFKRVTWHAATAKMLKHQMK
jgi:hypothetical protein